MSWKNAFKEIMQTQSDIATKGIDKVMQPTSIWAANSVDGLSIQNKVLCEIANNNSTDQELEKLLNMSGNSIRPARVALVKKRLVQPTGETKRTDSGRLANIWEVTVAGKIQVDKILHK
tara:strand:+ start:6416 stop:6772 length:357 start_codon:yes stop_codon:yes gene_type:complete